VHVADPAHGQYGEQFDPGQADWTEPPFSTPPYMDAYVDEDDIADANTVVQVQDQLVLDQTDYTDHSSSQDHGQDLGAPRALQWNEKNVRGPGETYDYKITDGFGPSGMVPTDENLRRGINADPINNPTVDPLNGAPLYDGKGFRYGIFEDATRGRNRKFLGRVIRLDHGVRAVYPNTAYQASVSRQVRDQPIFRSLSRNILMTTKRPMLRQAPTPIGDTLLDDTPNAPAGMDDSIVEGF
jgi:hypothetical protein